MYAFFDRDNVGLPGFANYFKEESLEERSHAEKLIDYQNLRGGRVLLGNLMSPITEFDEADKGEALYAISYPSPSRSSTTRSSWSCMPRRRRTGTRPSRTSSRGGCWRSRSKQSTRWPRWSRSSDASERDTPSGTLTSPSQTKPSGLVRPCIL